MAKLSKLSGIYYSRMNHASRMLSNECSNVNHASAALFDSYQKLGYWLDTSLGAAKSGLPNLAKQHYNHAKDELVTLRMLSEHAPLPKRTLDATISLSSQSFQHVTDFLKNKMIISEAAK